jgi:hypothetical protein
MLSRLGQGPIGGASVETEVHGDERLDKVHRRRPNLDRTASRCEQAKILPSGSSLDQTPNMRS